MGLCSAHLYLGEEGSFLDWSNEMKGFFQTIGVVLFICFHFAVDISRKDWSFRFDYNWYWSVPSRTSSWPMLPVVLEKRPSLICKVVIWILWIIWSPICLLSHSEVGTWKMQGIKGGKATNRHRKATFFLVQHWNTRKWSFTTKPNHWLTRS